MKTFLDRPIEGDRPYVWIDATYLKMLQSGFIVAFGVTGDSRRSHTQLKYVNYCDDSG